jgi:pyruvate dehydrogenase E2 component (dihydrolipoamide acetyltransferase)
MAEIVRMPQLSDTMTEGVVAKWHKKVGDKIKEGDLIADIETDKATMEFESFQEGVLLYIGVEETKTAPVNSILAILGEEGEDISKILEEDLKAEAPKEAEPEPVPVVTEVKEEPKPVTVVPTPEPVVVTNYAATDNENLKISPLAKKMAEEKGIDVNSIIGSGDDGRIVKRDIDNFNSSTSNTPAFIGKESFIEEPLSQMRKTIARRLGESKFSAPHFYLTMEINMDKTIIARQAINTVAPVKISFNDIVIKGVAQSLNEHPKVNASWLGDKIRYNKHINIGVAIAVEEGLLVPVVRFANGKTLSNISTEVRAYADKAKEKKLQPSDWEGNTFTISNLGMFGIDEFTAIINAPDACILAVGGIKQVPIVKDGQIVPGNIMKVTLSCDHRVVDGAAGAAFLQTLKHNLENPVLMLGAAAI